MSSAAPARGGPLADCAELRAPRSLPWPGGGSYRHRQSASDVDPPTEFYGYLLWERLAADWTPETDARIMPNDGPHRAPLALGPSGNAEMITTETYRIAFADGSPEQCYLLVAHYPSELELEQLAPYCACPSCTSPWWRYACGGCCGCVTSGAMFAAPRWIAVAREARAAGRRTPAPVGLLEAIRDCWRGAKRQ